MDLAEVKSHIPIPSASFRVRFGTLSLFVEIFATPRWLPNTSHNSSAMAVYERGKARHEQKARCNSAL